MKKTLVAVAGLGIVSFAVGATKPIAQWSFDDASNLGKDSIGANDLIACVATESYGTPKTIADGYFGAACDLKRTSSSIGNAYRSVTGNLPTGNSPFTVSAWVRPNSSSSTSAYLILYLPVTGGKPGGWTGSNWNGWYLRFPADAALSACFGSWKSGTDGTDNNVLKMSIPSGAYKDGKWHHVVLTRDAANKVRLFWDGTKSAEKTINYSVNATSAVRLGSYESNNFFSGDYDEVKVWDCSLTDFDILQEYRAKKVDLAIDESAALDESVRNYGTISGSGTLTFGGVSYQELLGSLSFGGTYRAYASIVDLGYANGDQAVPAASKLEVTCTGGFNVNGNTTVAGLSGAALLGAVNVAAGKTLTVAGDGEDVLNGRLNGDGSVVKKGTGSLTVNGASSVKAVSVEEGSLAVGRAVPFYAPSLTCYWRFEDAENLGRDLCDYASMTEAKTTGGAVAQTVGKFGRSLSLRKGSTVASALLTPGGKVGCGTGSFTVSAWIRPNGDSAENAYVLCNRPVTGGHPGSWTGSDTWKGWHLRFWAGKLAFGYTSGWASPSDSLFVMGALPSGASSKDGKWHHVAVTRDSTDSSNMKTTIYFDGTKLSEKVMSSNQNVPWACRLILGGEDDNNSFSGDYDEVKVYNRALSAEQIASDYAAAKPQEETSILDEATARWTFDALVDDGERKLFKDTGSANLGCDFLNTTNSSGQYVECVTGADINGGAAYIRHKGSYLQLADSSKAKENLMQYSWPHFTVSIRIKNVSLTALTRNPVFCFGNATGSEGCLRLSYEGTDSNAQTAPQIVRIFAGNSYTNGTSGVILDDTVSQSSEKAPWTTYTFVNDAESRVMTVYRDGIPVKKISTHGRQQGVAESAFKFDLSRIDIGYNTYGNYNGFMVDDLCVFRKRVLSAKEVKRLVLEQVGATDVPFKAAEVSVAAAATLDVEDRDLALKSVSGAGEVKVGPYATLAVDDWSAFAGSITGDGGVVISGWGPACRVAKAIVAPTGTVAFAENPEVGKYTVVTADALEMPPDFSGWTVQGLAPDAYKFKVVGNAFKCVIRGGMIMLVR